MSNYFVIVGALRNAANKMRDGMTPEDAFEATADEMVEATRIIDESRGSKKKRTDLLMMLNGDIAKGIFEPKPFYTGKTKTIHVSHDRKFEPT